MSTTRYFLGVAGWAALHVVWLGALLPLVYRVWERGSPSPRARYGGALACLAALPAALALGSIGAHVSLVANARRGAPGALAVSESFLTGRVAAAYDGVYDLLPWIVVLWGAGVLFGIARLTAAHRSIISIVRAGHPAPPALRERVRALARALGLPAPPRVRVTGACSSPFVVGGVTGALVLPTAAIPGDELDALIAHELVHLRRGDYGANWALQLVRALFWFHPGVSFLVRAAMDAREECCDAEAVRKLHRPLALARALVRLEEQRLLHDAVIAASGGALATRIHRLLDAERARPEGSAAGWLVPVAAALALCALGAATAAESAAASDRLAVAGAAAGALPAERIVIDGVDPAGRFTLTLLNGRVAGATVAGRAVDHRAIRLHRPQLSIVGAGGEALLTVHLDPRGSITWRARPRRAGG